MRASRLLLTMTAVVTLAASPAGAQWTTVRPGIRLRETDTVTQHWWAVAIDTADPHVGFRATRAADRASTVSVFARRYGVQVAINGGFFDVATRVPTGLAMADGTPWHADDTGEGFLALGADGRAEFQRTPHDVVADRDLPSWYRQAVGGHPTLIWDGASVTTPCPAGSSLCSTRNPRTASGLSRDGHTLYLVTVDGRMEGSSGMTLPELAAVMLPLGVWRGINHDGGGSTTLYIEGRGVLNHPSDGVERVVADHLGVVWRSPHCTGGVRGLVRDRVTHRALAGATLSFSDGTRARTDATGHYSVTAVDCDVVTLAASATGHVTAMRDLPVDALSWSDGSIDLAPVPVVVDAGVRMDGGLRDVATVDARREVGVDAIDEIEDDVPAMEDVDEAVDDAGDDDAGAPLVEADGSTSEWDGGVEAGGGGATESGGCSCSAAGVDGAAGEGLGALALAALVVRRRRRRAAGIDTIGRSGTSGIASAGIDEIGRSGTK